MRRLIPNLVFDESGNLMLVSYAGNGTVYAFKPGASEERLELLKPIEAAPRRSLCARPWPPPSFSGVALVPFGVGHACFNRDGPLQGGNVLLGGILLGFAFEEAPDVRLHLVQRRLARRFQLDDLNQVKSVLTLDD